MHESVSVINSIELIPLEDTEVNPFLTRVRIKVFHLGENRNHSYIDKPTALSMAKTLRGNPIVARFREEDNDFTDHGQEITLNDKGITKKVMTRPYGFVDLNARVWFEDYNDVDENGQVLTHTYLVTEGLVWSAYYKELQETILKGGRPQSMELDEETLQGNWTKGINPKYDIFIINDAIITKLCALGENTEPCFLGASIEPIFSSLGEENFVRDLMEFKAKFNLALSNQQGGSSMETEKKEVQTNLEETNAPVQENFTAEQDKSEQQVSTENQNNTEEFVKKEEDNKEQEQQQDSAGSDDPSDNEDKAAPAEKKKPTKNELEVEEKYFELERKFNELNSKYAELERQNKELLAFKLEAENKEKDALIAQFYMLSDEDKKDVIENKSKYSLDDIEAKLSVICVRKKVNFNDNEAEQDDAPATTFNLNGSEVDPLPAWLRAVENQKNRNN